MTADCLGGRPIRIGTAYERFDVIHFRAPLAITATALAGLLLTSACGGSSSSGNAAAGSAAMTKTADGVTVNTALLAFKPMTVEIRKGQTVTWVGGDNITHVLMQGAYQVGKDGLRTSQQDAKVFDLTLTKKGQTVSHTFDQAGTFPYYCSIHHGMNGVVHVS